MTTNYCECRMCKVPLKDILIMFKGNFPEPKYHKSGEILDVDVMMKNSLEQKFKDAKEAEND